MAVLTFLSDFGADSHYMASFRGAMHQQGINLPFIEISSGIEPFDIVEGAYLSGMVFQDFPEGSIHVLAINVVSSGYVNHLVAKHNGHYFLAPNNGILSLIFGEDFTDYYAIPSEYNSPKIQRIYLPFIASLIQANHQLEEVAQKAENALIKMRIHPVKDEKELRGTIIFVDHFGNAYTNISEENFNQFLGGSSYSIQLARHSSVSAVSSNFSFVQDGDPLCYFSEHGYLVASIKKGSAKQLLNLRKYKSIIIEKS